jgi:oxygen-independent coproporphyrinogen-3 oxidase
MITSMSKRMMKRSFEKTLYRYTKIPDHLFNGNFGIYIHVPFCYSKCSFCPFYKKIFSEERKRRYLDAIFKEIDGRDISGQAKWLFFGGGTPNTLTVKELGNILDRLRAKVQLDSVGIELLPALVTTEYLKGLKRVGFTKISIGVESFSDTVIGKTGRKIPVREHIEKVVKDARSIGLWVNVDMMVGLPDQDSITFLTDIEKVSAIHPDQVTIYPFMVIRGIKAKPGMPSSRQFELIEEANDILENHEYARKGVWTFALGDDIYDSSRDELIEDYVGFGPAAFSTYGDWKVVNPELEVYVNNYANGRSMGFVAPKSKSTDDWRKFARTLYDLKSENGNDFPFNIKLFNWILRISGYSKHGLLTRKGKIFAHEITKTVVESLPFPVQNPGCVENYDEYVLHKRENEQAIRG